jgi:protein tyrosine phosphatase (PTP) superfamily phosphohydrolase (DUF442 family)
MTVSPAGRTGREESPSAFSVVTAALLFVVGACLVLSGCTVGPETADSAELDVVRDASGRPVGLESFRRWSARLAQGGQPTGEVAFANLAAMGFRRIVSVDGARPDAETAAKYGLEYVHVPFGYDGVPRDAQVRIVKAVASSQAPVYVHCHHGVARGPAGAMIARIALEGVSNADAAAALKQSGCSEHYKGLYRDVLAAVPPTAEELARAPEHLPAYVSVGTLAEQMASLDRTWARVGLSKSASWSAPLERDIDPAHEARMLWEKLREIGRLGDVESHGPEFLPALQRAEEGGHALEEALLRGDRDAATKQFGAIKHSCDSCHAKWRD